MMETHERSITTKYATNIVHIPCPYTLHQVNKSKATSCPILSLVKPQALFHFFLFLFFSKTMLFDFTLLSSFPLDLHAFDVSITLSVSFVEVKCTLSQNECLWVSQRWYSVSPFALFLSAMDICSLTLSVNTLDLVNWEMEKLISLPVAVVFNNLFVFFKKNLSLLH